MTFNRNKLRFALLMSLRETRAAAGKFAFLVLAIALGTGALTAVTGFNASVRYTLTREARSLMAADISVRLQLRPPQSDLDTLKSLESEGASRWSSGHCPWDSRRRRSGLVGRGPGSWPSQMRRSLATVDVSSETMTQHHA